MDFAATRHLAAPFALGRLLHVLTTNRLMPDVEFSHVFEWLLAAVGNFVR